MDGACVTEAGVSVRVGFCAAVGANSVAEVARRWQSGEVRLI